MVKTPEITPELLRKVYFDNVRAHQLGGETDGIPEEVAEDLGFASAADTTEIIREYTDRQYPWEMTLHEKIVAKGGIQAAREQLRARDN